MCYIKTTKKWIQTISTPKDHQSADIVWPFLLIISGAMYSIVPQKENAFSLFKDSLHRPKSVRHMWPSSPNKILLKENIKAICC